MWELVEEKREEFSELFAEIIEDITLARAIREGEASEPASRGEHYYRIRVGNYRIGLIWDGEGSKIR